MQTLQEVLLFSVPHQLFNSRTVCEPAIQLPSPKPSLCFLFSPLVFLTFQAIIWVLIKDRATGHRGPKESELLKHQMVYMEMMGTMSEDAWLGVTGPQMYYWLQEDNIRHGTDCRRGQGGNALIFSGLKTWPFSVTALSTISFWKHFIC